MKQIENIDLTKLNTNVALGYLLLIAGNTSLISVEDDQEVITSFNEATSAFNDVIKPNIVNSFTASRKAAGKVTNKLYTGFRMYTKAMVYSPDAASATIAESAYASIKKYGRLTRMGYKEQYPNLQALINELKDIPESDLNKVGLTVWIEALYEAYLNFMSITAEKIEEDSHKQIGIVQDSRDAAEEAYYTMINRINAGATYLGDANYAAFIDTVNVIVGDYKAMIASAKTRAKNSRVVKPDEPSDPTPDDGSNTTPDNPDLPAE